MTTVSRTRRRRALLAVIGILVLQVLISTPAHAAAGCVPNPERVTSGFIATIDEPRPTHGLPDHWYGQYHYAGTRWHTYTYDTFTLLCGDGFAQADTWAGNQLFNIGKTAVAGTNSLWYLLLFGDENGTVFGQLDTGLSTGAKSIYDNAFMPLLSLVLLLAVVWMLFKTLKGALAHIATKLLWVLCAFWIAASSYLMPLAYTTFLDTILTDGIRQIQGAVLTANGYHPVHGMPQLLYDHVIKKTWLEGEFGTSTSPLAREHGPRLIDAQAWSKFDTTDTVSPGDLDRKKATYTDIANKVRGTAAEGHFTGSGTARLGTGLLGLVRGLCFAYFPLLALLGQLLGMLILRLVILFAPILGLAMIVYQRAAPGIIRGLGKALAGCVLLAVGSTAYLWALSFVLVNVQSALLQMVIMAVMTIIALILIRPIRQLTGMISGIVQAAGLNYATHSTATGWAMRTWRRHRRWNKREKRLLKAFATQTPRTTRPRGRDDRPETTPHEQGPVPHRGPRPEAGAPQRADSIRMPTARQHGPAHRAGAIGPRVIVQGPRVFHHGPATPANDSPEQPPASQPGAPTTQAIPTLPVLDIAPSPDIHIGHNVEHEIPDRQPPHQPTSPRPVEELVVPSKHDERVRRRAEGTDPEPPSPYLPTDKQGRPVVEIYHPSQDQILTHPTDSQPRPYRPEIEEQGDTDADPV